MQQTTQQTQRDETLAITEVLRDFANQGPFAAIEYESAIETYRAYDDGVLEAIPLALDAYLDRQRAISI